MSKEKTRKITLTTRSLLILMVIVGAMVAGAVTLYFTSFAITGTFKSSPELTLYKDEALSMPLTSVDLGELKRNDVTIVDVWVKNSGDRPIDIQWRYVAVWDDPYLDFTDVCVITATCEGSDWVMGPTGARDPMAINAVIHAAFTFSMSGTVPDSLLDCTIFIEAVS